MIAISSRLTAGHHRPPEGSDDELYGVWPMVLSADQPDSGDARLDSLGSRHREVVTWRQETR